MTFQMYLDKIHEWRWRLVAENGKIIADSAEGYKNFLECEAMIDKIRNNSKFAEVSTKEK